MNSFSSKSRRTNQQKKGKGPQNSDSRSRNNKNRRIEISGARLVAYDVLRDVEERDAYANLALPARIREAKLDSRDAALATELVAGTLRMRGRYDRIIELAANRQILNIDAKTLNVLRLGAHQLLSMRVPGHAAVNESVELQRRVAQPAAAGFVNGVLRSISRSSNEEWEQRIDESSATTDEAYATKLSHPEWIVRAFRDALRADGREHELQNLLEANNTPPRVSLAVLDQSSEHKISSLDSSELFAVLKTGPSPLGYELVGGDPAEVINQINAPAGTVRVQDPGSQLAALVLTRFHDVAPGERWLDLCAGPGGKTAVLGAEARRGGATVRANEVSTHRAELVKESTRGFTDHIEVVSHDGRTAAAFGGEQELFDRILVDAPCSGLGALRRRPEARWRKQATDIPELTSLQLGLLESATKHLAVGGLLAYVTCSPHLAETRVVLSKLLRSHPELEELNAKSVVNETAREPLDLGDSTDLSVQLWPHRHGTDAMFIALLRRKASL